MIYASENVTRWILIFCLFVFFVLTMYFINEVKKIEKYYDDLAEQITAI